MTFPATGPVTELRLCDQEKLGLRPNHLYRFTVKLDCERCIELATLSDPAYLPPEGLCGDRAAHERHLVEGSSLGDFWCAGRDE